MKGQNLATAPIRHEHAGGSQYASTAPLFCTAAHLIADAESQPAVDWYRPFLETTWSRPYTGLRSRDA